jgi:hypothetical protein
MEGLAIDADGVLVKHILDDGRLKDHGDSSKRLVSILRIRGSDMFRSEDAVIEDAYARQGDQIAYREHAPGTADPEEAAPNNATGGAN